DGLGTSAPGAALSVCAEAAKTLSDADIPHAGRAIFEATGGSEEWARRLARGRQPAVLAQALRDLIQLDKVGSKDVVAKLYGTPTRLIVVGRPIDALTAAVRSAMVTDAATAAMLVGALQVIDDDLTRSVLETIYEDSHTMYIFFGEVTQIQNPMKQADVATAFARTGMRRGTREGKWLNAVYEWRVKTAHAFVSPRAAEALVRMTAVWDINWGNAIAENLSTGRIVKRLSHGRRDDLGPTVRLIRTLCAIDRVQQAGEILDGLLANDIATIAQNASISALCQLVDITGRLRPEHVGAGLRHLRTAIMTMVEDSTYLDERALWQRIGRALVVLRSFPG
ncbi:hypothetical protein ACGF5C_35375, partial [Micromonospora sp. NPDC047620]|uniref:hypothetical protein n=1 Tax=Micromonospora sp. NPDC047620 TaxID=3364251 RepID=UPI00371DFBBC